LLLQALAAENVALDNQLLEVKSAALRLERDAASAAAVSSRLEQQLAALSSTAAQQGAELTALQAERRVLKARLMQVSLNGYTPPPPQRGHKVRG
jgi:hypothetical protein